MAASTAEAKVDGWVETLAVWWAASKVERWVGTPVDARAATSEHPRAAVWAAVWVAARAVTLADARAATSGSCSVNESRTPRKWWNL